MAGPREPFENNDEKGVPPPQQGRAEAAEAAAIHHFISHSQSTHNIAVTNSVGVAILALKKRYFGNNPTETNVNQHLQQCTRELKRFAEAKETESLKPNIDFILAKIKEPLDPHLDRVTLITPSGQEESYGFHLSEVLTLVWLALKDHAQFTHHYEGTAEEKQRAAENDYKERLINFWTCLERIRTDRVCHHGNRNELMFVLNETHKDVHLIEDSRLTVIAFLKENINKAFKKTYKELPTPESKKQLLEWMETQNASLILKTLDPDNSIIKSLELFFIHHGVNPKSVKLDTLIDESLQSLEFSCDPKKDEFLFHLNQILNFSEDSQNAVKSEALQKIKKWIKSELNTESREDQHKIITFSEIYALHDTLKNNQFILKISGRLTDELDAIATQCEAYFKNLQQKPNITPEQIKNVHLAIEAAKKDTLRPEIENFFARWFSFDPDDPNRQPLYEMLLSPAFQEKAKLTDETIQRFLRTRAPGSAEVDVTPYELNRIFLHAYLVDPQEWSPLFTETFDRAFQFVKNDFNQNQEAKGAARALKASSYNYNLLWELETIRQIKQDQSRKRLPFSIRLPHQVKDIQDWVVISRWMSEETLKKAYQIHAVKIDKLILEDVEKNNWHSDFSYRLIKNLKCIPITHRIPIILRSKKIEENVGHFSGSDMLKLLPLLPINERISFLKKINWTMNYSMLMLIENLTEILKLIPIQEKLTFLREQFPVKQLRLIANDAEMLNLFLKSEIFPEEYKKELINEMTMSDILSLLEKSAKKFTVVTYLVSDLYPYIKNLIENSLDFVMLLNVITADEWSFFIEKTKVDLSVIKNAQDLIIVLNNIPSQKNCVLFMKLFKINVRKLNPTEAELREINRLSPPSLLESFSNSVYYLFNPKPANAPRQSQQRRPEQKQK